MIKHLAKQKNASEQGFSLVETLVAITILLIVIIGPLTISSQSARSTSFASEQVIAFFLAQEGLEIVRKGRDDLVIRGFDNASFDPWDELLGNGTFDSCLTTTGCGVQIRENAVGEVETTASACPDNGCPLYFDDSSTSNLRSRYTFDQPGTYRNTPYRRSVTMEEIRADEEIRVVSTVYWRNSDQREVQSVSVESYLFNIYD